jgi:hypothetical protein
MDNKVLIPFHGGGNNMTETSEVDKMDNKAPHSNCKEGSNMTEPDESVAAGSKSNQGYLGVIHMADYNEPLPIRGRGGTCHYQVSNEDDTSLPHN